MKYLKEITAYTEAITEDLRFFGSAEVTKKIIQLTLHFSVELKIDDTIHFVNGSTVIPPDTDTSQEGLDKRVIELFS